MSDDMENELIKRLSEKACKAYGQSIRNLESIHELETKVERFYLYVALLCLSNLITVVAVILLS